MATLKSYWPPDQGPNCLQTCKGYQQTIKVALNQGDVPGGAGSGSESEEPELLLDSDPLS